MSFETQPEYQKVVKLIKKLDSDGLLTKLAGNCVLAADVFQNMLYAEGITSRVVECQLLINKPDPVVGNVVRLVGYNFSSNNNNYVDTHVVVVTETATPMIIDLSIGHLLKDLRHVIVAEASIDEADPDLFGHIQAGEFELFYRHKKSIALPEMHQKDLVTRLRGEHQLRTKYKKLSLLVWLALGFSAVDVAINTIILLMKMYEHNYLGL